MCILMYPVASEMMKEHITYFHNNKAKRNLKAVILPGDFLQGKQGYRAMEFKYGGSSIILKVFAGSHNTTPNQKKKLKGCFHLH